MKQAFITAFLFCSLGSFAQNTSVSSDKRILLPPLVVESVDPGNTEIRLSDAVPLDGQKYETSQRHTLLLVPIADTSQAGTATATEEEPAPSATASPLPSSSSTTSQADKMILVPVNTQKP